MNDASARSSIRGRLASAGDIIFGQFRLVREIGRGGMGTVWLGTQEVAGTSRAVGIKTLAPELAVEHQNVELFLGEARIITLLNHPNIVSVLQGGPFENAHYIVMEYVDGETIGRLARAHAKVGHGLPPRFAVNVIRDVALALFHAHTAVDQHGKPLRLVHRDVSPQNIMVRLDGVTKLLDFGIARVAGRTTRTETGILRGKLRYLAPEQFLGQPMDGRTDQFALGIVLWELLTGTAFIEREDLDAVWKRLSSPETPRPSAFNPLVPTALDEVVLRMLNRAPDQRFGSCQDVAQALTHVAEALPEAGAWPELVDQLAGEGIRARTQSLVGLPQTNTETIHNQQQCPGCQKYTLLSSKFCPTCGRVLGASLTATSSMATAKQRSAAVSLVLVDVLLSAPAAVGPLLLTRALRAVNDLGRECGAQVIGMRPTGMMLVVGLPRAASDDATRAVSLAERISNMVRVLDPGIRAGVVITSGLGVVSGGGADGTLLVLGPVLEQAEQNRAELKTERIVLDAGAARAVGRPTRELSSTLVELIRTAREIKASTVLLETGREAALGSLGDWLRSDSRRDRIKVWSHRSGDGASSLLKLLLRRCSPSSVRAQLLTMNGLDHARPFGLIRRIVDEALETDASKRVAKLQALGITGRELELTHQALEQRSVDRPEVLPSVVGASLLAVLAAKPMVVLIDDAHSADVSSLRLLNHVATSVKAPTALVLVSAASGLEPLALIRAEPVPSMREVDFQQLWLARTSATLEASAATQLWAAARGAVGRAIELADEAVRVKALGQVGDRWVLVAPLTVPNEAATEQRLGTLSDEARKYLERAAVLGVHFSKEWVHAALGLRTDDGVLDELVAARFFTEAHRFVDEETRAVVEQATPGVALRRAKVELAFTANEAFPAGGVAALLEEARLFAEADHPNAIRSGLAAATRLEAVGASLNALEALTRVLRKVRVTPSPETTAGAVAASVMRVALGCAVERGVTEVRPVLEQQLDEATRAGVVPWFIKGLMRLLKTDEAEQTVQRALTLEGLDVEVKASILGAAATVHLAKGQPKLAHTKLLEAFHAMNARPAQAPQFYWEHLNLLGRACVDLGDTAGALAAFTAALEQAERVESDEGRARASTNLAGLALRAGRTDEALKWLSSANALAVASLDRQELARVQLNRANVLAQLGQSGEALAAARLAEQNAAISGWVEGSGLVSALLRRLESGL